MTKEPKTEKIELANVGVPTFGDEASDGSFSWEDTIAQPEDPFFAYSPVVTQEMLAPSSLPETEPGHKERFDATFESMIKGKK